jgi:hypothetical protein
MDLILTENEGEIAALSEACREAVKPYGSPFPLLQLPNLSHKTFLLKPQGARIYTGDLRETVSEEEGLPHYGYNRMVNEAKAQGKYLKYIIEFLYLGVMLKFLTKRFDGVLQKFKSLFSSKK